MSTSGASTVPTLQRETLPGRSHIAAEHARLLGDQVLQVAELALAIGTFGERDEISDAARATIEKLERARELVRQAREALRGRATPRPTDEGAPA